MEQLFESKATGTLHDTRFRKLSDKYEAEQAGLDKRIKELQNEEERLNANRRDASAWLALIKNYADIQELDRVVLGELVEKITVYYRFVGAIITM